MADPPVNAPLNTPQGGGSITDLVTQLQGIARNIGFGVKVDALIQYSYTSISTTPAVVAPINGDRKKLLFHNPGTVDIFVFPSLVTNSSGAIVALSPSTSVLGGCFRVYANGGDRLVTGNAPTAWQAFSASGSGNPLTVEDHQ